MSDRIFQDIKLISSKEIQSLICMEEAINAMEQAFASFSDGTSQVPQRYVSAISNLDFFIKPAYNEKLGKIAVKIITQKEGGNYLGIPAILNAGAILGV